MTLRNFNLPQRQPIHSPLPKLRHKNQESSSVRLLLFSVPSLKFPFENKIRDNSWNSSQNSLEFRGKLQRLHYGTEKKYLLLLLPLWFLLQCGDQLRAASTRKPKCTRLFSHEARRDPSLWERETENEGCWVFASKAAAVYHRLSTWMQNHHIRMINSSIQTLFFFFKSKKSKLEFSFLQKNLNKIK